MENALISFEGNTIRKVWYEEQWYFSLVDIIGILTESKDPKQYFEKLRKRDKELDGYIRTNCTYVDMKGDTGKMRKYLSATTEGVLRIVMSIPSPKAEPLKLWLAEQGKRAIDETENPELMTERQIALWKSKGYTDEWIKERLQNIETRKRLTDEWQKRGVKEGQEYSVLTAVISKGTFDIVPSEHKQIKGLTKPSQNLRDHMTPLELIFTSLGEELTRRAAIDDNAQGFNENKTSAIKGGYTAGEARKRVEEIEGKKVVSPQNYLGSGDKKKPLNTNSEQEIEGK